MARQNISFVDQHIEKVVVGVCALALLGVIYFAFLGGRFSVEGMGPAELTAQLGQEADQTAQAVLRAQPPKSNTKEIKDPANDPVKQLDQWFGANSEGLAKIAGLRDSLRSLAPSPPKFIPTTEVGEDRRHNLAKLVPPIVPVVATGRAVFELPADRVELKNFDGKAPKGARTERNWVSVGAQIDLAQQEANFSAEQYPPGSYLAIVKVHLQRFDQNEPWRGWQEVETYLPFRPLNPAAFNSDTGINFVALNEFRQVIEANQNSIARTQIAPTASGHASLPHIPFIDEAPTTKGDPTGKVKAWTLLANKAMEGKKPFDAVDLDAAYVLSRTAVGMTSAQAKALADAQKVFDDVSKKIAKSRPELKGSDAPHTPERQMPIVAHDLSVVAGHTYTYRIRYEAYNIFAGNKGELKNIEDAKRITILSDWSLASRPVQVTSDVYFYLTKADAAKKQATVTIFKKARGSWVKEDFKVQAGDPIGGKGRKPPTKNTDFSTGTVCVDVDFNADLNGKKDVALIIADKVDGTLQQRYLSVDKNDKLYKELDSKKVAQR